jgi:hypothetical protein
MEIMDKEDNQADMGLMVALVKQLAMKRRVRSSFDSE